MALGIPDSTIEEIRSRVDLVELISSSGVAVRRSGSGYMACCPFHHEKTPSFSIRPEKGVYHCFGCGKSGDAFTYLMEREGLAFADAVRKLAAQVGVAVEEREDPQAALRKRLFALHEELAAFYRRCLLRMAEAGRARDYLASRRLPEEVCERFQLGYAPAGAANMLKWAAKYGFSADELDAAGVVLRPRRAGESGYHRFGGRLMFPIKDRMGRVVAFSGRSLETDKSRIRGGKYVNSPETPVFRKAAVLYGLSEAAPNIVKAPGREAIVCEGQIDVIRCHACGFATAVASQGTAFTPEHVALLKRCCDSVVLVFDADGAGLKAAVRTGGEFLAAEIPVRVASLPEGEDPDSLLRDRGADAFRACLSASESITAYQVRVMRAAESRPDSIDAVRRVSAASLRTLLNCPSAVLRASLIREAAELMSLPVAALEDDFAKLQTSERAAAAARRVSAAPSDGPPAPDAPGAESEGAALHRADASAAEANPPPRTELALCELLFDNERDGEIASRLELLPPEVLSHEFTRMFVEAWRRGREGGADAFAELRGRLDGEPRRWLDRIVDSPARSAYSELSQPELMEGFLRRLWADAVRRRLGESDAAPTEENARRRYRWTMLARDYERAPWERARALMTLAKLEGAE